MSTPAAPSGAGSAPPPPAAELETLEEADIDPTLRSVPPPAAMRESQPDLVAEARSSAPNLDAIAKRARAKLALKIPDDAVPAAKSVPPPPVVAKSVPPPPVVAKSVPPPAAAPTSNPPPPASSGGALVNAIQAMRIISVGDSQPGDRSPPIGHDAPYVPPTVMSRPSSPPRPVSSPPRPVSTPPRPRSVPPRAVSQPPQAPAPVAAVAPIAPPPPAVPTFDLPPAAPIEPPTPADAAAAEPAPPPPPAEPVSLAAADVLSEEDVAPAPDSSPAPLAEASEPARADAADDDGFDVDVDQDGGTPGDRISDAPELDPSDVELAEAAAEPTPPAQRAAPPPAKPAAPAAASIPLEPPTRKRGRPWWEELFGDDFLRTMEKLSPVQVIREVSFIEESLGVEQGGVVLDLACGAGRHAVELASRGYNVVGYDLSLAMLARAADEAQDRDQKLNFLHGDMREMGFEEMFDGVYSWSTSFGFFDEEKNALVAERVHRALRRGGRFLLDVANRDYVAARQPSLVWFEGDGCVCMDEMSVDFITSRLRVKRTVMLDDGRTREIDYSIRLYALHELGKLLHGAGFKITEVSGQPATPGVFFGADSPRLIILAEKA